MLADRAEDQHPEGECVARQPPDVRRAPALHRHRRELSLAEVAAAGFSDQNQFTRHVKWLAGVAPGQFRVSVKIGERQIGADATVYLAILCKKRIE